MRILAGLIVFFSLAFIRTFPSPVEEIAPAAARADSTKGDPESAFSHANQLEAEGEWREAARAFESLALDGVDPDRAPESLFRAALIHDRHLGSYRTAIDLYRRLAEAYPHSRFSKRAGHRAERLEQFALENEPAFRTYEQATEKRARGESGTKETIRTMLSLVEGHPDSAVAPMALLAAARELARAREHAEAGRIFQELLNRYPDSEPAGEARMELGDLAFEEGRYREALDHYTHLSSLDTSRRAQRAREHLLHRRLFRLCTAILSLFTAAGLVGTPWRTLRFRRVTWPWVELAALAVFTLPLLILALGRGPILIKVILCQSAATAALLFGSALWLDGPPRGRPWRLLFPLAVLLATASAAYTILYLFDLAFIIDRLFGS